MQYNLHSGRREQVMEESKVDVLTKALVDALSKGWVFDYEHPDVDNERKAAQIIRDILIRWDNSEDI